MPKQETQVENLKINRGTYEKILANIDQIGENELIITTDKTIPTPTTSDNGKIVAVENGDYSLKPDTSVKDVKNAAGTSLVSNHIATIPTASTGAPGMIKVSPNEYFTYVDNSSKLGAMTHTYANYQSLGVAASFIGKGTLENVLDNESVRFDKAVTLTDTQKLQARNNIGASKSIEIEELD